MLCKAVAFVKFLGEVGEQQNQCHDLTMRGWLSTMMACAREACSQIDQSDFFISQECGFLFIVPKVALLPKFGIIVWIWVGSISSLA